MFQHRRPQIRSLAQVIVLLGLLRRAIGNAWVPLGNLMPLSEFCT